MIAYCPSSNFRVAAERSPLRCPITSKPLEYTDLPLFQTNLIDTKQPGLWRYAAMLPVVAPEAERVTLGEGWTYLVPDQWAGIPVYWKNDALMPSGSYKDRGVSVMLNWLIGQGATLIVEDSSGNAGASVACYAARAGLRTCIFVPESAPDTKKTQIAYYGAELVEVPGSRNAAADAAVAATRLNKGTKYASHTLQPSYLLGLMTCAWEIWEQLGQNVPDWFVVSTGQGGLLLSVWRGFQHLQQCGLIDKLPKLVAVQAEPYTPIHEAFTNGLTDVSEHISHLESISADGIAISKPLRSVSVLTALRDSNGTTISVNEKEVLEARESLAQRGLYVEPTSAAVGAAITKLRPVIEPHETVVAALCSMGLKRPPEVY